MIKKLLLTVTLMGLLLGTALAKDNVITLTKENSVVLDRAVNAQSISKLINDTMKLSSNLAEGDPIYLVLNTPGGSVIAGRHLIDSVKPLTYRNPIHTVTIFAASMGYHIAQNLGTRYVLPSGILMSHRARIGGIGGQIPGELNTMIDFISSILTDMDNIAAARVGMTTKNYRELILNEHWMFGKNAVETKHADNVTLAKCGPNLSGTYWKTYYSPFGAVEFKLSRCPLISSPLDVRRKTNNPKRDEYFYNLFNNKMNFFRKYISNNLFN